MNEVKSHDTGEECNACGSTVTDTWGRVRCSDVTCITRDRDNDLSWDSPAEEILAVQKGQQTYGRAA